ncbi:FMN-dependent NADH-azoreductase [Nonomuraea sp. NPDC001831]|uniref:FMN-dependent NADH-azoreductase n=1 Tax=Nonomuraea sp. NPDC001831 TaxID=3364340 RepID=UPI003673E522
MAVLLHLDASARRRSISRELGDAFAEAWRSAHPEGTYVHRDLAAEPVPHIGEAWTELCDYVMANQITDISRYHEAARTPEQAAAWAIVEPLLSQLVAADVVLIATPMYNYSIPSALKAWLDQVTFPKMSLTGRRFVVTTARGGAYSPGAPKARFDYQERYLRDFFAGHFAVEDTTVVAAELANSRIDPGLFHLRAQHDELYAAALRGARDLGKEF